MGRPEMHHGVILGQLDGGQIRKAAVHAADRIAAQHPHELDELMPRLAGRQLAADPIVATGLLELLDVLGIRQAARRAS